MAKEITAQDFEKLVLSETKPVIVDFYSTECPPCEALAPKFDFFHELYQDEIKFYKIFRQGNKELSTQLGVSSSPTLLFFQGGKEVAPRLSGAVKKSQIKEVITKIFGLRDQTLGIQRQELSYELVIIGGGPAGLTAGLYAGQAKLKTLILDQGNPGGQVNLTHLVANYPGTGGELNGFMLMHHMSEQVRATSTEIMSAVEIKALDLKSKIIDVDDDKRIRAKAIILATGSSPRRMGIPGEEKYFGRGISYCATCDGKFYEGKPIYVIGGGNSAVEESLYLTNFVDKITMIHQFDTFQANQSAVEEALHNPKIEVLWNHEPRGFLGGENFEKLEVEDLKTGQRKVLSGGAGVFVFIGYQPQNDLFKDQLDLDKYGYVGASENMETEVPGVFVAGDIRAKQYRQITTAVSDGTVAALNAEKFIRGN